MPRGDKSSYSNKQKRQAAHIEESYRKRGLSENKAEERAWRTVNKQTGGAKKKSTGKAASRSKSRTSTAKGGAKPGRKATRSSAKRRSRGSGKRSAK
jgi:plasmid stabilization system protein ParE